MNNRAFYGVFIAILCLGLSGCADTMTFDQAAQADSVGFLHGLFHGIILPLSFICSLFMDDIAIYAIYNNGGWYDLGFFLGVGGFSSLLKNSKKKG